MSIRITTGGVYHNYKNNLHASMKTYSDMMTKVETGRSFTSYAEDPASASRAFQLRRTYWRTGDQIDNSNYLINKYSTGWDALDSIVDGTSETPGLDGIREALTALNGTAGNTRHSLGTTLWNMSESIMKVMNTRYGDEFVFAGADGMNAPFSWDDSGHMCYRGFQVNAPKPVTEEQFAQWKNDGALNSGNIQDYNQFVYDTYDVTVWVPSYLERLEGATTPPAGEVKSFEDATFEDYQKWYVNTYAAEKPASGDMEEIREAYARAGRRFGETAYEDIGIGMRADEDGYTIPGTAFDSVISGLEVLGYGMETVEVIYDDYNKYSFTTEVSNNLAEVMRQLAQVFLDCNEFTGEYKSYEDRALADTLTSHLQSAISHTQEQQVVLDGKVDYLQKNLEMLTNSKDKLDKQIVDLEDMDPADAITSMTWAQYCYSAALRVGQQILGESLLDYLR